MISKFLLSDETADGGGNQYIWIFVAILVVLVVALLVVPMFTNKKRAKETYELHNSLKPGDVIKTVGGIIGTIIEVRQVSPTDKEMVIETGVGDNKTTMVLDIQALYQVISRVSLPYEESTPVDNHDDEIATEAIANPVADNDVFDYAPEHKSGVDVETVATEDPVKDAEPDAE